jgi:cation diffusion facilitator family transporter
MAGSGHGNKAVIAALLANTGIAIAKFVGFAVTRSGAMLAEAIHSVADAGNQALLLLGGTRARRRATVEHPFGYGRERYFWAFVVALVLFSLGGAFALYEGVQKIRDPHELESVPVALVILGLAIVLEAFSFRTAIREARAIKGDAGWWQFIRRSKNPELPVVLLEDLGAQVGLVLAFLAVLVAEATGDPVWDGYGTLAIGVLLTVVAVVLAVEMKSLLIGEGAAPDVEQRVRDTVGADAAVVRLIHMRTQHLGPEELLVAMKVELVDHLSVREVTDAIDRIEAGIRLAVPEARIVYVEPDVFDDARSGARSTADPRDGSR